MMLYFLETVVVMSVAFAPLDLKRCHFAQVGFCEEWENPGALAGPRCPSFPALRR